MGVSSNICLVSRGIDAVAPEHREKTEERCVTKPLTKPRKKIREKSENTEEELISGIPRSQTPTPSIHEDEQPSQEYASQEQPSQVLEEQPTTSKRRSNFETILSEEDQVNLGEWLRNNPCIDENTMM